METHEQKAKGASSGLRKIAKRMRGVDRKLMFKLNLWKFFHPKKYKKMIDSLNEVSRTPIYTIHHDGHIEFLGDKIQ